MCCHHALQLSQTCEPSLALMDGSATASTSRWGKTRFVKVPRHLKMQTDAGCFILNILNRSWCAWCLLLPTAGATGTQIAQGWMRSFFCHLAQDNHHVTLLPPDHSRSQEFQVGWSSPWRGSSSCSGLNQGAQRKPHTHPMDHERPGGISLPNSTSPFPKTLPTLAPSQFQWQKRTNLPPCCPLFPPILFVCLFLESRTC